jgi:hypothetical protein
MDAAFSRRVHTSGGVPSVIRYALKEQKGCTVPPTAKPDKEKSGLQRSTTIGGMDVSLAHAPQKVYPNTVRQTLEYFR